MKVPPKNRSNVNLNLILKIGEQMKKTKFTERQIIGMLREQEQGKSLPEICRANGSSPRTTMSDRGWLW
jgi:hypothetical protein